MTTPRHPHTTLEATEMTPETEAARAAGQKLWSDAEGAKDTTRKIVEATQRKLTVDPKVFANDPETGTGKQSQSR